MDVMKPFDFINSINFTKKNMMRGTENDDLAEKSYVPYITNRTLSYFTDTLLYANEMNRFASTLDSKLQYEFLLNSIRPKKRFAKWSKPEQDNDLEVIREFYNYSIPKARQALSCLTNEQVRAIKNTMAQGITDNESNN
jgi:AAA15 family ATPase/GTPase